MDDFVATKSLLQVSALGCPKPVGMQDKRLIVQANAVFTEGLHLDCTPWVDKGVLSPENVLCRNWAFWTTFCQV